MEFYYISYVKYLPFSIFTYLDKLSSKPPTRENGDHFVMIRFGQLNDRSRSCHLPPTCNSVEQYFSVLLAGSLLLAGILVMSSSFVMDQLAPQPSFE